jgi:hypothetical protein
MDQPQEASGASKDHRRYRIRIQGRLDQRWSTWFDGMSLTYDKDGTTLLEGHVGDQAALHGLIRKVGDLGLTLLEVTHETPQGPTGPRA